MNRTLVEKAKCLLFDAGLATRFWAEAINMATLLNNVTVTSSHGEVPWTRYYNTKPDLSQLRLFGTPVMVHVEKGKRDGKFGKNSTKMVFVGYDPNTKGYRCVNPNTGETKMSRNVKFLSPVSTTKEVSHEVRVQPEDELEVSDETPTSPKSELLSPGPELPKPASPSPLPVPTPVPIPVSKRKGVNRGVNNQSIPMTV